MTVFILRGAADLAHSGISRAASFRIYFYPTVYWLQGSFLVSPSSSSHQALNWTQVNCWLEFGVSLVPLWEQERCCGEESGPDHSGKVTADGGKAGLSTSRLSGTKRSLKSRQLPSALEKEARQAGRAGQCLRKKGARTLRPGTGQALSWLSMPA